MFLLSANLFLLKTGEYGCKKIQNFMLVFYKRFVRIISVRDSAEFKNKLMGVMVYF